MEKTTKKEKFNQAKYIQEYQKEKYDRCIFNLPKGQKKVVEKHYKKIGFKSLNAYINDLIRRDMNANKNSISVTDGNINGDYKSGDVSITIQ